MERVNTNPNLSFERRSFVGNSSFENGDAQETNKSDQTKDSAPARGFLKAIFDFLYMIISLIPPFSMIIELKKENAELKNNLSKSNARNKQLEKKVSLLKNKEETTSLRNQVCKDESRLKKVLAEKKNLQEENAELKNNLNESNVKKTEEIKKTEEKIEALQEKNRVLNLDLIKSRSHGVRCNRRIETLQGEIVFLNAAVSRLGGLEQVEIDEEFGFSLC